MLKSVMMVYTPHTRLLCAFKWSPWEASYPNLIQDQIWLNPQVKKEHNFFKSVHPILQTLSINHFPIYLISQDDYQALVAINK